MFYSKLFLAILANATLVLSLTASPSQNQYSSNVASNNPYPDEDGQPIKGA